MPGYIRVDLKAEGQGLRHAAPSVMADGTVDRIVFDVELSPEWDGFERYAVLLRSGRKSYACEVREGKAVADAAAVANAGPLEAALVAEGGGLRMTTERITINLHESNR